MTGRSVRDSCAWLCVSDSVVRTSDATRAAPEQMAQLHTCRHLACPVSLELMVAPVRLMETGQVYQSTSICSWFAAGGRVSTLASWSSLSPPAFLGLSASGSICSLKRPGSLCMHLQACAATSEEQAAIHRLGRMK